MYANAGLLIKERKDKKHKRKKLLKIKRGRCSEFICEGFKDLRSYLLYFCSTIELSPSFKNVLKSNLPTDCSKKLLSDIVELARIFD